MSQHDFNIANQTAPSFRTDLNNALQALATLSSGASAPSTTFANMLWYDTTNNILKMRSEADDAWISIGYLDQSVNAFRILDDTQVTNTSGTQTGLLGDQATATWEAGTGTTESLVSPAKVKAAIDALATTTIADGSITEAKLASSAVSRVKMKTGTNSGSYSTGSGGGSGTINMDAYSFFPAYNGNGTVSIGGTSADAPAINWSTSTTASGTVYWRYVQA